VFNFISNMMKTFDTDVMYFGDPNTDGTWKIERSRDDRSLRFYYHESGSYVEKGSIQA